MIPCRSFSVLGSQRTRKAPKPLSFTFSIWYILKNVNHPFSTVLSFLSLLSVPFYVSGSRRTRGTLIQQRSTFSFLSCDVFLTMWVRLGIIALSITTSLAPRSLLLSRTITSSPFSSLPLFLSDYLFLSSSPSSFPSLFSSFVLFFSHYFLLSIFLSFFFSVRLSVSIFFTFFIFQT